MADKIKKQSRKKEESKIVLDTRKQNLSKKKIYFTSD